MDEMRFSPVKCLLDMTFDALHVIATFAFISKPFAIYAHVSDILNSVSLSLDCILCRKGMGPKSEKNIIIMKVLRQDFDLPDISKKLFPFT